LGIYSLFPVDIPVQEDDNQGQNQPKLAAEYARSVPVSEPTVVTVADADNSAGVREEPRIDTPTFAFTSSIDLRSITTDEIPTSLLTTTSAAVTIAAPAGLGPVVAGVCEEPKIDIATFAFASSIDLRRITADSIPNSTSTTTSAAAAPTRIGHRSGRGWEIIRKASSPLVGQLRPRPRPSNMELKMYW
jgi:hypothetical protein